MHHDRSICERILHQRRARQRYAGVAARRTKQFTAAAIEQPDGERNVKRSLVRLTWRRRTALLHDDFERARFVTARHLYNGRPRLAVPATKLTEIDAVCFLHRNDEIF